VKKYLLVAFILMLVIIFIFTGCAKTAVPGTTSAPPPSSSSAATSAPASTPASPAGPGEIVIGAARHMSGMFAGMGQGGDFGFKAAIDDINSQGGIFVKQYNRKIPVKEIMLDSQSDPNKVGSLTESLVLQDKVNFITTSNGTTGDFVGAANLADRFKIPYISVVGPAEVWGGVRSQMTPPWEYAWALGFAIGTPAPPEDFRNKPGYTQMESWMEMLAKFGSQTDNTAGIFASDDAAGRGFYGGIAGALKAGGVNVIGADKEVGIYPLGTNDFTSIIQEWKANKCDILWGNSPAPEFGTLWRQCHTMGYEPKMVFAGRAGLYYTDVAAWGGNLPLGIGCEIQWSPSMKNSPGIGNTTPQSLADRWAKAMNQPLNEAIGWDYTVAQVLFAAIEKAGTLNGTAVNQAIQSTDSSTIWNRVLFDTNHFSRCAITFGQWVKTDKPGIWEHQVVLSQHDFVPVEHDPIFPVPY
jgi:branched-chain amino acid transport system substrate-binding protein